MAKIKNGEVREKKVKTVRVEKIRREDIMKKNDDGSMEIKKRTVRRRNLGDPFKVEAALAYMTRKQDISRSKLYPCGKTAPSAEFKAESNKIVEHIQGKY